ncbi:MAG: hypothetical protein J7496_11260 [Novosphingobium sp.]|nr:hypothetical protein [Novosphingobium sp.]MBO9603070.1 hypothetical protein [Novosphingobium sp.]
MSPYLTFAFSLIGAVTAFAIWRGGAPERRGGVIMAIYAVSDPIYHRLFSAPQFRFVDPGHVVMDSLQFIALTALALRANRMWPLWAASSALIAISGHLALLIGPRGLQRAYWAMTQLPLYPELLAVLLGTIAHRLRYRRIGPYRDWRAA